MSARPYSHLWHEGTSVLRWAIGRSVEPSQAFYRSFTGDLHDLGRCGLQSKCHDQKHLKQIPFTLGSRSLCSERRCVRRVGQRTLQERKPQRRSLRTVRFLPLDLVILTLPIRALRPARPKAGTFEDPATRRAHLLGRPARRRNCPTRTTSTVDRQRSRF
ncbi:MAG: hypothetical protein ACI9TF_001948 [Paracrocinitomix sp.]|jgi:hypothetical protein